MNYLSERQEKIQSRAEQRESIMSNEEMKELKKRNQKRLHNMCRKSTMMEMSERKRRSKKVAEIWKLEKDEEGGGFAGTFFLFSHAGHRLRITSKR